MSDFLILVPARYESSRFPGKPLAKILDKPMIQYVIENCVEAGIDYAVVTDNQKIEDFVQEISGRVVRVDDQVETGSERIALAYQRYFKDKNYKFIINVQGDEPLLDAEILKSIVKEHQAHPYDIFTAVKKRSSTNPEFLNPNVVKCVFSESSRKAHYFSRSSIPYARGGEKIDWYQHIGIYSYQVEALEKFVSLEMGKLEKIEKLEQLRALDAGMSFGVIEIEKELIGVDTPEDIKKVEGVLK